MSPSKNKCLKLKCNGRAMLLTVSSLMVFTSLLVGCSGSQARISPSDAYDTLALECLNDNVDYVRVRIAPAYLGKKEGEAIPDPALRALMTNLRLSRAVSWKKTDCPDTASVNVASVAGGNVVHSRVNMVYDEKTGWRLVGKAKAQK